MRGERSLCGERLPRRDGSPGRRRTVRDGRAGRLSARHHRLGDIGSQRRMRHDDHLARPPPDDLRTCTLGEGDDTDGMPEEDLESTNEAVLGMLGQLRILEVVDREDERQSEPVEGCDESLECGQGHEFEAEVDVDEVGVRCLVLVPRLDEELFDDGVGTGGFVTRRGQDLDHRRVRDRADVRVIGGKGDRSDPLRCHPVTSVESP